FRTRLVAASAEERFLEALLTLCKEHGWLKARGHQRTDSTHVLAKVRAAQPSRNVWWKRCATPSISWSLSRLTGCELRYSQRGWSAMGIVLKNIAFLRGRTSASSSCIR